MHPDMTRLQAAVLGYPFARIPDRPEPPPEGGSGIFEGSESECASLSSMERSDSDRARHTETVFMYAGLNPLEADVAEQQPEPGPESEPRPPHTLMVYSTADAGANPNGLVDTKSATKHHLRLVGPPSEEQDLAARAAAIWLRLRHASAEAFSEIEATLTRDGA
jgi:hypothetical protein